MVTTIDAAGRVVIPKHVRERLGLHGGSEIVIELVGGHIEIHPKGVDVVVERLDDGPVLRPAVDVPVLTADDVRAMVQEDRES
jgi:AbrB family looped-hinge helix DNA binding protein